MAALDQLIDQEVTLSGVARNAHAGAVLLMPDRTPVYIDDLPSWEEEIHGKNVQVTGTLRQRKLAPDPTPSPGGGVSHGIHGQSWVLEGARWTET